MKKSVYEEAYTSSPNADYLHGKRMEIYQKYGMAKMTDPSFNMSVLEFMETVCPEETELIGLEKIRVEENKKIFDKWKHSGDPRSFQNYASQEYGFNDSDDLSKEAVSTNKQL